MNKAKLLLIFLLSFQFLAAQNRIYTSQRLNGPEPRIDGLFDDEVWNSGEWSGDFTQYSPDNGAKPSQKTEFKILYDDDNIYVAIKAYDTEPDKIEKRMSRRDGWTGDRVVIEFDSYFDKRTSFIFGVSASGVKNDGIMTEDSGDPDDTRDPIWYVKTHQVAYGWNAEMKIPLSQLRFSQKEQQVWGLEVLRYIYREQETNLWQHIADNASGWVSRYGELRGLRNINPKRQVEIAPYMVSQVDLYEKEEGNPFADGRDFDLQVGVDGKIGITNDLTLDFTINPDFGQVEADPSEVNLSAFETFFEEKRPFFVEGNNITNFQFTPGNSPWSSDNLFYSRRIGRRPQGNPDYADDEYIDIRKRTRILGALKLTGKTRKGWSVGIMESVTNREKATIGESENKRKETVEPLTNYFLARVQKDINKGNTIIGGMVTSTYRDIDKESLNFLNKTATTGGLDFTQYFKEKKYFISAKGAVSHITGDKEAILEQQLSSRRYYQRPDADYVTLDSSRTSLTGHAGTLLLGKSANRGLRYVFNFTWRSPGFETNDMGFMRRANTVFQYFWIGYSTGKPFSIFRRMSLNANQWAGWDFGGTNTFRGGNVNMWVQFKNLWSFNANVSRGGKNVDNTALRGGPAFHSPGSLNYNIGFGTNSTKKLTLEAGFWENIGDKDSGRFNGFYSDISYRPINALSLSLSPNYNRSKYDLQYIDEQSFNGEGRYIFASIDQKTLAVTMRIDYNITPDLTIQFYGSPFVSGGLYSDFKKITDPKADTYTDRFHVFGGNEIFFFEEDDLYGISESGGDDPDYFIDNPDFNFRQFRSNLVLRWEYKPGALFYFVWSQARTDFISDGTFDFFNDLKNLFSVSSHDVLLLKFSYLFKN